MNSQLGTSLITAYSVWNMGAFAAIVVLALWIDLCTHKKDEPITLRNATIWSTVWVVVSLLFACYIGYTHGRDQASLFLAGYLLEKSLSVDNLFVFMSVFAYFGIVDKYQHRILYFGILGALLLRFIFISAGSSLLLISKTCRELAIMAGMPAEFIPAAFVALFIAYIIVVLGGYRYLKITFNWFHISFFVCQLVLLGSTLFLGLTIKNAAMITFGAFVLWSAVQMVTQDTAGDEEVDDYSEKWYVKITTRIFPVHPQKVGHAFFTRQNGILHITPMFICLIAIEFTDVAFAFDSVPAVISITQEPFLVYTSNIFAILGLRSMYFLLTAAKKYLRYLDKSVIVILVFIGIKMLLEVGSIHIPADVSLAVVLGCLATGIAFSLLGKTSRLSGR